MDMGSSATITGESETSYAYSAGNGYIQSMATLNAPSSVNPGGLGAVITSGANMGSTIVRRSFLSASNASGSGNSILRRYNITPTNNTGLNATLRFQYLDAELNGLDESSLVLWRSTDDIHWTSMGFNARNTATNYVELAGINSFSSWDIINGIEYFAG